MLTDEELEQHYEKKEVEELVALRKNLALVTNEELREQAGRRALRAMWSDELTYLSKTTWIVNKKSEMVLLKPNYAQIRFYEDVVQRCRRENRMIRGIALKARQLGYSTLIQALQNLWCDEHRHRFAMTVSYDEDSTEELFQKTKLMRDRAWFARKATRERGGVLHYAEPHGSVLYTCTAGNINAGRGRTLHHLHCSELPMWADAEATLQSVHQCVPKLAHTSVFHESTAKGAHGEFYDMWCAAEAGENSYIPFFAPWFWDPEYTFDFGSADRERAFMRTLNHEDQQYQATYKLTPGQMAWRAFKTKDDLKGSRAKFKEEYPACAEEAFLTSGHPVFSPEKIREMQLGVRPPLSVGDIFFVKEHEESQRI